ALLWIARHHVARIDEHEVPHVERGAIADDASYHDDATGLPIDRQLVDLRSVPLLKRDAGHHEVDDEDDQADPGGAPGHRHEPARPAKDALVHGALRDAVEGGQEVDHAEGNSDGGAEDGAGEYAVHACVESDHEAAHELAEGGVGVDVA